MIKKANSRGIVILAGPVEIDLDVDIGSHSHHSRSEQQEISIQKRQPIALPIGFSSELTEALESKQFNCDCIILGDDT